MEAVKETRHISRLPEDYGTVRVNPGINAAEMKRFAVALAENGLTFDKWVNFKAKEAILAAGPRKGEE